ncbi:copper resistance protein CopC [Parafrankia soli]|uniref:Copper resistance protein CopC n=1 Tax=Parafrankia soli TaxID=2599596 RepID=A0A1S1Q2A3_9ACTN|nr:copper resistance CopC family protein [Parafrankia soli]OHV27709.1 copper resistance protein CopC [Parafrankia soli]
MQRRSLAATSTAALTTLTAVAAMMLAVILVTPRPAWAHSTLRSSDPADGSTLSAPPTRISLVFGAAVWADYATVAVTRAGGGQIPADPPQVTDTTLSVAVRDVTPGDYHVAWRVVSADGHPINGEFSFAVAAPPATVATTAAPEPAVPPGGTTAPDTATTTPPRPTDPAPTPPATSEPAEGGGNGWIIGVIIAGLAVVGGTVLLIRRNRE